MKKIFVAGVATVALVGTGFGITAYAQSPQQPSSEKRFDRMIERVQDGDRKNRRARRHAWTAEDRAAFIDSRIAAVKAGLRLTAEQEKHWGPVEAAARELGKKWTDRWAERREERQKRRAERKENKERPAIDHVERLRKRADALAERAADLKRFADAAQPLYATLDDGQKRRLQRLIGHRHAGKMHRWHHRDRDDQPRRG